MELCLVFCPKGRIRVATVCVAFGGLVYGGLAIPARVGRNGSAMSRVRVEAEGPFDFD